MYSLIIIYKVVKSSSHSFNRNCSYDKEDTLTNIVSTLYYMYITRNAYRYQVRECPKYHLKYVATKR